MSYRRSLGAAEPSSTGRDVSEVIGASAGGIAAIIAAIRGPSAAPSPPVVIPETPLPAPEPPKTSWVLPSAIVGGALVLGALVIFATRKKSVQANRRRRRSRLRRNGRKITIYEALRDRLGRAPTNGEISAEVRRIISEASVDRATKGKLPHQRKSRVKRNGLFDDAVNMHGAPMGFTHRKRLMKFFNDPTEANWNLIASIVIAQSLRHGTVWQAVRAIDPTFPGVSHGNRWSRVPDPMLVARAIKTATAKAMKKNGGRRVRRNDASVGKMIAQQLGNMTLSMIGAKNLMAFENGLQFSIGRNAKSVSKIVITLDPSDTYTVQFWRGRGVNMKLISESDGVYFDQLHKVIESHTGLYTRM